jgi:uncharacterized protein YoxC
MMTGSTYLILTIAMVVLLLLLIITMGGLAWSYDTRSARLPQATQWSDLKERNAALLNLLAEKQDELKEIQRRIEDRDRIAAEVASLSEHLAALRAERDGLRDAELQIDDMKRKAADAAMQLAEQTGKLAGIRDDLGALEARKQTLEAECADAEARLARLPVQGDVLTARIADLQDECGRLEEERATLRAERAHLLSTQETMASRSRRLEADIAGAETRLAELLDQQAALATTLERRQAECNRLEDELGDLRAARVQLLSAREEQVQLAMRCRELEAALTHLTEQHQQAMAERDASAATIDRSRAEEEAVRASLRGLTAELQQAREEVDLLSARKAALEIENKRLEGSLTAGPAVDGDDLDLRQLPACLAAIHGTKPKPVQEESAAIEEVRQSLGRHGLKYSARTIDAFHTSLKINEVAQLTVLAGVSGTGKSLLPRRYAEAMGINFLPIAVEPRWDSPQDLLGFYNYVEKRYRATELARAMVHMDPQNTSQLSEGSLGDRMLLVLLDEMNLARVEYYFSEFLSRLEIRPRWSPDISEEARRQASMPLDTRGRQGGSVLLFPSHNVLFVGTMNDDESTQALSDKVLDRGNVMQFPAPATFDRPQPAQADETSAERHLEYRNWRGWIRDYVVKDKAEAQKVQTIINRLAEIMRRCGRPFGHRLNEAMMAYVANYPRDASGRLRIEEALADQIELRILPKLRGVVIDEGDNRRALEDVVTLISKDLHDSSFADHLQSMLGGDTSQFNWRGLDRNRI